MAISLEPLFPPLLNERIDEAASLILPLSLKSVRSIDVTVFTLIGGRLLAINNLPIDNEGCRI
jgi:hypothetical protein